MTENPCPKCRGQHDSQPKGTWLGVTGVYLVVVQAGGTTCPLSSKATTTMEK